MGNYAVFAQYYDALTANVGYGQRAEYFLALLERLGHTPGLTLDLACGTGSLTLELFRRGLDVYGVDSSVEMLSEARMKCAEAGADILFLCQKMQSLDLYGTVDTVVCSLDSLNHLDGREEMQRVLEKVAFFMSCLTLTLCISMKRCWATIRLFMTWGRYTAYGRTAVCRARAGWTSSWIFLNGKAGFTAAAGNIFRNLPAR